MLIVEKWPQNANRNIKTRKKEIEQNKAWDLIHHKGKQERLAEDVVWQANTHTHKPVERERIGQSDLHT